ncbi:MAG: sugar phosphate isomerase/epimerase [Chloroflexi bacterium]|nr:sugar phosphate isomerase/epimerase [Chloroflexota bacterium]
MQLSLSGRIVEAEHIKTNSSLNFVEFAELAARVGFNAICVRATHLNSATPLERVREMRGILEENGLVASMVMLDSRVASQGTAPDAAAPLRNITPTLERATAIGADMIRVAIKHEEDIPWAQRAADEAREHGIRLAHQNHTKTPFETVADCVEMFERIDRPNLGLIAEPANFMLCGEDYGAEALKPLAAHIFNVYVQNLDVSDSGSSTIETNRGAVRYERLVIGDAGGVNLEHFHDGLNAIGYAGFVTSNQPAIAETSSEELSKQVYAALARFAQ